MEFRVHTSSNSVAMVADVYESYSSFKEKDPKSRQSFQRVGRSVRVKFGKSKVVMITHAAAGVNGWWGSSRLCDPAKKFKI